MWANRQKTFSGYDYPVVIPYQSNRNSNRTITGAVGGTDERVEFIYQLARKTNKESVMSFIDHFVEATQFYTKDIVVVTDNHSSHKSKETIYRAAEAMPTRKVRPLPCYWF